MSQHGILPLKILRGTSDKNIGFDELVNLLKQLSFQVRVKGRHPIFLKKVLQKSSTYNPQAAKRKRIR